MDPGVGTCSAAHLKIPEPQPDEEAERRKVAALAGVFIDLHQCCAQVVGNVSEHVSEPHGQKHLRPHHARGDKIHFVNPSS